MKRWTWIALVGVCLSSAFADEEETETESAPSPSTSSETVSSTPSTLQLEYQVTNARKAALSLDSILGAQGALILHREESSSYKWASTQSMIAKLKLSQMAQLESTLAPLGEKLSRQFDGSDNSQTLAQLELEKAQTQKKLETYTLEMNRYKAMDDTRYQRLWDQVRAYEEALQEIDKNINSTKVNGDKLEATITLKEERPTSASQDDDAIKYVNMPGAEYTLLSVSNPNSKISSPYYKGLGLKYVFTRGKSNITVSPLKADGILDSTGIQEMLLYSFGQDIYSIRRATKSVSFLNLYTGYDLGGMLTTYADHSSNHWFANLNLGLELFKTSRLLLDLRGSYFLPFYQNPNLRGFMSRASLNYVF